MLTLTIDLRRGFDILLQWQRQRDDLLVVFFHLRQKEVYSQACLKQRTAKTLSPASLFRVLFMISSRRCGDQTGKSLLAANICLAGGSALTLSLSLSPLSSSPSSSPVAPALPSGSVSPSQAAGAQPPRGLWPRPPPSGKRDQQVTIGQLANHNCPHVEKPH